LFGESLKANGFGALSQQNIYHTKIQIILVSNNFINSIKTFEKLIEFKDSFVKMASIQKTLKK
jgi:hypothetical protein